MRILSLLFFLLAESRSFCEAMLLALLHYRAMPARTSDSSSPEPVGGSLRQKHMPPEEGCPMSSVLLCQVASLLISVMSPEPFPPLDFGNRASSDRFTHSP